jgi:hypothetical protein
MPEAKEAKNMSSAKKKAQKSRGFLRLFYGVFLKSTEEIEENQNYENGPQAAGGIIAPRAAIGIDRQGSDQQEDQNNQ